MPRVRLSPSYWEAVAREEFKKPRQADIAEALGIYQSGVSNRIKTLNFTLPELARLVQEGVIPVESLRKVVESI